MQILSVIESLDHGGAETVMVNLATGFPEHRQMVIHFSSANSIPLHRPFVQSLREHAVPCKDVHYHSLKDPHQRASILDGFQPEIVIFHWWGSCPILPWILQAKEQKERTRPLFLCVLHHNQAPAPLGFDHYVLVCKDMDRYQGHIPRQQKSIIYNGIDLQHFTGSTEEKPPRDRFVIGRISTLRPCKIPKDWVRIANSFDIPGVRFVIAGEGSRRAELRREAQEIGASDKFSFPGYISREDVPRLLSDFDLFCYVTDAAVECNPLVLLESLAAGVPVVSQEKGGIPDIIVHGENGFLGRDTGEVRYYCELLSRDLQLREQMAVNAREFAKGFCLNRQREEYNNLFSSLMRNHQN
jgi:glycosyltransferase involved in cell wall biosynthesis